MGFLDDVKKKANKENLKKLQEQAQAKIDEAQDKLGTSGKPKQPEGGQQPAEQPAEQSSGEQT